MIVCNFRIARLLVLAAVTIFASLSSFPVLAGDGCSKYSAYVTFDADGGTGSMSKQTLKLDDCSYAQFVVPACSFKRKGYRFVGWRRDCCCMFDDEWYEPGDIIWDLDECVPYAGATMKLTACWEEACSAEEDYLYIELDTDYVELDVGDEVYGEDLFYVSSGSDWTLTVSGLPSGLKFDAKSRTITGTTTKRGVYYSTFSAKNDNGYKHSAILKWNVGEATENEYDNIGGIFEALEEFEFVVGESIDGCISANLKSVSGLPSGVKFTAGARCVGGGICTACSDFISGIPTKAGKFTLTFTDKQGRKAVKNVIVRDCGSRYLSVSTCDGQSSRGTVTKSGVYEGGKKVSITATAKSGYYFAGWYYDRRGEEPFEEGDSGDYRTAKESFVMGPDYDVGELYARFVSKAEDSDIVIDCDSEWDVCTECGADSFWIEVESESKPTLTAKGLPTGVKLTKYGYLEIADTSKLKPGTTEVTLTAKNLSGATTTRRILVKVPNLQSWVFSFSDEEYANPFYARVGEAPECHEPVCTFDVESGWTVTASGLPSGLKFTFDKNYGYGYIRGRATKAGTYTVTLTAKNGSQTQKATITVVVLPFPSEAVGTYGGVIGYDLSVDAEDEDGLYCISEVAGSFSMTVSTDGKISVKFTEGGKTVSMSGYSCSVSDESVDALFEDSRGNWCELLIYLSDTLSGYQVYGLVETSSGEWDVLGQRNVAKTDPQMKQVVTKLSRFGKIFGVAEDSQIMCPYCVVGAPGKTISPNVTFTVGSDGMVKMTGKIEDRSVSCSAMLMVFGAWEDGLLYADFSDYKSSSGLLTVRVVFSRDAESGSSALSYGEYDYSYWGGGHAVKPVIYLYPEEETICDVKVDLDGRFTCTYPDYGKDGWREFVASPDGTLTFADQSQYYCLYWEGDMNSSWDLSRGYCVKGSETAGFFADILPKLGLSFREANEFIIYWLPLMQDNPYNVITFQEEKYTDAAKLEITPKPDSLLRVFMVWYSSAKAVNIIAPELNPFDRKGFVAVEWGGMRLEK